MPEIVFPMSLEYVKDGWDAWAVVREFGSNAKDADPQFFIQKDGDVDMWLPPRIAAWARGQHDNLMIFNRYGILEEQHLLLGVSQKPSADAIGMFGEGAKIAMLVLTRMGLTAHIFSGGLHFWNEPAEVFGVPTFKVVWEDSGEWVDGTAVFIPGWEYPDYNNNFLHPGDDRIVFTDPHGRHILAQMDPDFFVKGVWVGKAEGAGMGYAFGYNLVDPKMNRDRRMVSTWDANWEIGRIWSEVSDEELLERFFSAVRDDLGEKDANMTYHTFRYFGAAQAAFKNIFGENAVVETDEITSREAKHRGARTVKFGHSLAKAVAQVAGTDQSYIQDFEGESAVLIPDTHIKERDAKKLLKELRKLTAMIDPDVKLYVYMLQGKDADCTPEKKRIRLGVHILESPMKAISAVVHELAHIKYETSDRTEEHQSATEKIAAQLLAVLLKLQEV